MPIKIKHIEFDDDGEQVYEYTKEITHMKDLFNETNDIQIHEINQNGIEISSTSDNVQWFFI